MEFREEVAALIKDAPRDCILKRPKQICSALREAVAANSRAWLMFRSGADTVYNTMVLQARLVDDKKGSGFFILDELTPSSGHKRALAKERFTLRTNVQGVEIISMDNVLVGAGKYKGDIVYQVALPRELYYLQRRNAFRVYLKTTSGAEASFPPREGIAGSVSTRGRIVDLSFTGMKIAVPGKIEPMPEVDTLLNHGRASVPGKGSFEFDAKVRFASYVEHKDETMLGLQLNITDPGNNRMIMEIVNELQREERKESTGLA